MCMIDREVLLFAWSFPRAKRWNGPETHSQVSEYVVVDGYLGRQSKPWSIASYGESFNDILLIFQFVLKIRILRCFIRRVLTNTDALHFLLDNQDGQRGNVRWLRDWLVSKFDAYDDTGPYGTALSYMAASTQSCAVWVLTWRPICKDVLLLAAVSLCCSIKSVATGCLSRSTSFDANWIRRAGSWVSRCLRNADLIVI